MPYTIEPLRKNQAVPSFHKLLVPVYRILPHTPLLEAKGDRPLQMEFEHQLKALIFYHLKNIHPGATLFRPSKKMILPKRRLRLLTVLKRAVFSRLSTTEG